MVNISDLKITYPNDITGVMQSFFRIAVTTLHV